MIYEIRIERLKEIEQERSEVYADNSFQEWMKELKVSRLAPRYQNRASEVMSMWTDRYGTKNTFDYLIKTK